MSVFRVILFFGLVIACAASYPALINIGGLFTPIDSDGTVSLQQSEHLAAFLMAIKEINNKSDGLWDNILPSTELRFAIASGHGFEKAGLAISTFSSSFSNDGVVAVVGALDNTETMGFNLMARDQKIPQVHSVASSTYLGQGKDYPYKSQTCASDSFQGMVFQSLLCNFFKAKKLVVVSTLDVPGSRISQEVIEGIYCPLDVMINIRIESTSTNFVEQIAEMKASGGRYFALFLAPAQVAQLLEESYDLGMFREDVVFFSTTDVTEDILNHFSPDADVASIMTGYFSVDYWPNYSVGRRPEAIAFAQRWSQQASTAAALDPVTNNMRCNSRRDDANLYSLFHSQADSTICTGLNFSTYPVDGSTISPFTALTYEAVVVLATALDVLVSQNMDYADGDVLQEAIKYNVSFEGISGIVDIYEGMVKFDSFASGNREKGLHYKVINFNAVEFKAGRHAFVQTGSWHSDIGSFTDCSTEMHCFYPIFDSSADDKSIPPEDSPPDIFNDQSAAARGILQATSALSFFVVTIFVVFTFMFSKAKQVKASQPVMLYCILLGGYIASLRVLMPTLDLTDLVCEIEIRLGHLAFSFVFGGLFVKTWRVHTLVNSKTLKKVKFTAVKAFQMFALMMTAWIIYLIFLHFFAQPGLKLLSVTLANQTTNTPVCYLKDANWRTTFFSLEFIFLIYAFKICWAIKDVPDSVNESKLIASAMTVIVVMCCLVFPILFLIKLTPNMTELIAGLAFGGANVVALSILFVPKMLLVFREGGHASNLNKIPSAIETQGTAGTTIAPTESASGVSDGVVKTHGPMVSSADALHGMGLGYRVQFCQDQLLQWQALLMRLQEMDSDNKASSMSSMNESRSQVQSGQQNLEYVHDPALVPFEGIDLGRVKYGVDSKESGTGLIIRSFKKLSSKFSGRASSASRVAVVDNDMSNPRTADAGEFRTAADSQVHQGSNVHPEKPRLVAWGVENGDDENV